ncbi:SAM-dependent methyltransferase/MFS family permease [Lipingzhangella halophila]|uniref:SAM-dependent methyltransferase/MFS family permease n=1 Tax=Lipingzhangella halophila TaxID=1783352 RepID=A0A7W7W2L5_9ACTN|nr:fused MFS/spermidine synthase [Lipingzhangella halophila]MBB4932082.1 SAM-dependent methyltransferase/MFS family permease [Lipingzhangella halophila]
MSTVEEAVPASRPHAAAPRVWLMNALFTATILTSAMLIFAVQPMVSKMLLPPYGGAASVWTTSLLFFQTVLLVGYAYAHFAPKIVGRLHPLAHLALVALPLLVLPVTLPSWAAPDESTAVVVRLLLVLCVMVAMPFAVLSATGPLVQSWYSTLGMPRSHDPYFLYAASNIGSIAGLLAYPFIVEPLIGVRTQALWWAFTYGAFAVMISVCALVAWRARRTAQSDAPSPHNEESAKDAAPARQDEPEQPEGGLTWRRRLVWLALAALPSSLLQGTTTYISTDVAPVPLLWVVPLALYLSTYIVAFGMRRHTWVAGAVDISVAGCIPLVVLVVLPYTVPIPVEMLLSLGMLTVIALAAHGLLARDRPSTTHLTEFFLLVSLGGALGSLFNGVAAPLLFDRVVEYPLVLSSVALLCLFTRRSVGVVRLLGATRWARLVVLALGAGTLALAQIVGGGWTMVLAAILGAIAGMAILRNRTVRAVGFTATGLVLVVAQFVITSNTIVNGRTFFGSYVIAETGTERSLSHGTTKHGHQMLDPEQSKVPVSYFSTTGPLGDVFAAYGGPRADRVGVVGLGTGVIAAYGQEGQRFDFYEVDPEMVRVARNPEWFTYLEDCACEVETVVGDGRLRLSEEESGTYDIIVLDAFNSDSIPVHMLTREAFGMFADRLAPGGILAVHVSNRNLDLAPMVGATANEAGLSGMYRPDANVGENANPHADASQWVALASTESDLEPLTSEGQQNAAEWYTVPDDGPVWTDGYSSLFGVLRW